MAARALANVSRSTWEAQPALNQSAVQTAQVALVPADEIIS